MKDLITLRRCRLLGGSAAADAGRLATSYLCAVAHGQHIQGREFEYVAATPWNRLTFVNTSEDVLRQLARLALSSSCVVWIHVYLPRAYPK